MPDPDFASSSRAFALFDEMVDLAPPGREASLDAVAALEPGLAREVRELLAAYAAGGDFLDRGAIAAAPALIGEAFSQRAESDLTPGETIGAWRLVRPLGAGGMGEVWEVERADEQLRQRAALKLLKRGLDSDDVLRRFRVERQILVRLRHPAIAHLYDGGRAADGRPFYVMELVTGEPLTVACARRRLPLEERLRIFLTVCDAVAAAHRSLVVHRDLKPANVLLRAQGEVKLLDFGIAKLLTDDEGEGAATVAWERLLTPAYAAPEQILGEPTTTATDVYALGVVLYELLTGRLPHRRQVTSGARLAEEVDRETVERPSSTVRRDPAAGDGEPLPREERARRARRLRGDLDWILLRALAREPERRYPSAAALAGDLRRHLAGQPVEAGPDSFGYRAGKLMRRHRIAVGATAVAVAALLAGSALALWQARQARAQTARAELVKEFVLSLFGEQDPVMRAQAQARQPLELIAAGITRAKQELAGDPALQAAVLGDLAALQLNLGDAAGAVDELGGVLAQLEASAGADSVEYAMAETQLAAALTTVSRVDEGRRRVEHALEVLRERRGEDSYEAGVARQHLSRILMLQGDLEEALAQARASHRATAAHRGNDHPETLSRLAAVGTVLERADRLEEAMAVFREVAAALERSRGAEHAGLVRPLGMIADLLRRQQRYAEALPFFERSAALARQHLGANHPLRGGTLLRLGDLLRRMGRYDEAEARLDEAAACYPSQRPELGQVHAYRAELFAAQQKLEEAAEEFGAAHRVFLAALGPDSVFVWGPAHQRAQVLVELGRSAEAEPLAVEALGRMEVIAGPQSYDTAMAAATLGLVRRAQHRPGDAVVLHERAVEALTAIYGADHANTSEQRLELSRDLRARGTAADLARARAELDRVFAHLVPGTSIAGRVAEARLESARLALASGDPARARREAGMALAAFDAGARSRPGEAEAARALAAGLADPAGG
jgi:serine/threonine-protein kinase